MSCSPRWKLLTILVSDIISVDIHLLEPLLKSPGPEGPLKTLLTRVLSHGHIGDLNDLLQNFVDKDVKEAFKDDLMSFRYPSRFEWFFDRRR